ncbi:tetratricopeptide repeat protein [Streptomyces sp. BI20]|uniref:tetratricopeptide repeat protein n=1 Tax=Streptomyces sp. BI20 TaxID=3403460 RepID=UPI003C70BF91
MQPRNMSMSGVVDLAAVKAAGEAKAKAEQARVEAARSGGPAGVPASALVVDVDEANFEGTVLRLSSQVPVVIDFRSERSEASVRLGVLLERLAVEAAGRFVLARVDVEANMGLAQQFGLQALPSVFAVVAGQALPLFQDLPPEDQIRDVLAQLVQIAEERYGLTGLVVDEAAGAEAPQEPAAGPYDHLLDAAAEALDNEDLDGAIAAYREVLALDAKHPEALLGLAQAELHAKVRAMDPAAVRAAAAENPKDPAAQIAVAELDLAGGHVEDAFGRLVDTIRVVFGDDRDTVRVRLLELFEVLGADHPAVGPARTALARVLF